MAKLEVTKGYFRNGLPYARIGSGPRNLVIFKGLDFRHKPSSGLWYRWVRRFVKDFTVYLVGRKPSLPTGYSMRDMSEDYATMIKEEFGEPVDIMGVSTGGPIAQHFAVDHSNLIHRLVLAMTGYRLSENGKQIMRHLGGLVQQGKFRTAAAGMASALMPRPRLLFKSLFWLLGKRVVGVPDNPSDGLVEIEAEDKHDFKERLAEIKVPTLVIGGEEDFFYPIRETAAGIPNAKLILYEGVGHLAIMKEWGTSL